MMISLRELPMNMLIKNKSHLLNTCTKKYMKFLSTSSIDSNIYIRNTLNKDNELSMLNTSKNSTITWYSCGPTVYDDAHLGHARTYVCTDIIRRILVDYFGYDVNFAMGLTDIDDKIINKAKEINKSLTCTNDDIKHISRKYENDFFADLDRLNVRRPDAVLRVLHPYFINIL